MLKANLELVQPLLLHSISSEWSEPGAMKKILVIEDDACIRESIQDVLQLEGYQTLVTENGRNGVRLALEQRPDLILCDITMPEMDGYEVLTTLQQSQATNAIPFIFLTAKTTKAELRQGMNLGADDYLAKPCTAVELLNAISVRFEKQAVAQIKSETQLKTLCNNITQSLPHELYTPLNGILGFSELLYREYKTIDPNEIQEIAESIHTSALRLYRLMQNFLLYTNLELLAHNPTQLQLLQNKTTKTPGLVIQQIAEHFAKQANRYFDLQVQYIAAANAESVVVSIAESYLSKIVEELVDNALKFSEPGTPVIVQSQLKDQQFWLSVSNQGRGLTPEQIASLGAYMQFDRKSYEQQGTGLGLTLVKQIATLYNGNFQIHSVPGESTVIQIGLCCASDSEGISA